MLATKPEDYEKSVNAEASGALVPNAATSASVAAMALLAACGGGDGSTGTDAPTGTGTDNGTGTGSPNKPSEILDAIPASNAEAARFLQQAQFSSTTAEIADLRKGSYAAWLRQQFDAPQGPTGWDWLEARSYGEMNNYGYHANAYPADFMLWRQLMSGPDMMRRRMALALSEMFVVSLQAATFDWRSHAVTHYWDMLVKNAFGNFRQLLEDVTLHPAMGFFLNTKGNQKEDSSTGRLPDENYAREVMQLFTIGLYQLNPDGTHRLDASGNPIETYTPSELSSLARVFTGYDFDNSDGVRIHAGPTWIIDSRDFARKPMAFTESRHSSLAATFLGVTIPANTPGPAALKIALDTLFNHPNTGPFFARQMIQRLVTSNPSAAYVGRVAARFDNNGAGVRGDLRAVWSAILLDDEARSSQGLTNSRWGKLREPMLRLIQWARTCGVTSAADSWKLFDTTDVNTQLSQSPLRAPSVFNFFRPGFIPPGTALAADQAAAPEFQLVNETTVSVYLNYMQSILRYGISCPNPGVPQASYVGPYVRDVTASYADEIPFATHAAALVEHLDLVLCAGQMAASTRTLIVNALEANAVSAASSDSVKLDRIAAAVLMVMASAEYLIQK